MTNSKAPSGTASAESQAPEAQDAGNQGRAEEQAARLLEPKTADTVQQDSDSGHERTPASSAASQSSGASASDVDEDDRDEDDDDDCLDQECFEDAQCDLPLGLAADHDQQQQAQPPGLGQAPAVRVELERASLDARLEEIREVMRLALSNEFTAAMDSCEGRAARELYASLAHATLSFLRAALTLEREDLLSSLASINRSFEVSHARRRQVSTASQVVRRLFAYKPNYNAYSDDECHAELVSAESMLLLSLISFLADQSVLCLVRGAFRIRACYARYKECLYILETRTTWACDSARRHFESGVQMGHGVFNLLMSYLPRRALRFLEYVGFSGSRRRALQALDKSIELDDGLRSVFSALVILTYHSYVENLFGLGHYDDTKVRQLNETFLGHYPNSAFFLLFQGRYHQMQGQLARAIDSFERCCQAQSDWKQFHSLCHWEIMWCYACQLDWPRAAHYANLLRQHSKWSPSSYQYQYGTFLYQQLMEELRSGSIDERSCEFKRRHEDICAIIERVPELRIRYAGKTIPADKFAITRSAKFARQSGRLAQPALEFLYIWNIFCTLRNNPAQVERILERLDAELGQFAHSSNSLTAANEQERAEHECSSSSTSSSSSSDKQQTLPTEDLGLLYLLKGMCLKHLNRCEQAERTFEQVLGLSEQLALGADKFLVPHAALELALLKLHLKEYDAARKWIKTAKQDYTGYLMETIVHFRLHAAARVLRNEAQRDELEASRESRASAASSGR